MQHKKKKDLSHLFLLLSFFSPPRQCNKKKGQWYHTRLGRFFFSRTVRQGVFQGLRPVRTQHDAIVRMHARPLLLITAHTLDIPLVQIPAQILDLLVHEAHYGTCA